MKNAVTLRWMVLVAVTCTLPLLAQAVTFESLLGEMIDMQKLTYYPRYDYKVVQFSSYDRRSEIPNGPHWFANSDGFGSEPIPGFEAVLKQPGADGIGTYLVCDVDGPGAIVRLWRASIKGDIRLYLDHADTPAWEGPAADFFTFPQKGFAPQADLDPQLFDAAFTQRDASYLPIPFARNCRIEWIGDMTKHHFYQVQIRKYASDVPVQTFRPADLKKAQNTIRLINHTLSSPNQNFKYPQGEVKSFQWNIQPGERRLACEIFGTKIVDKLTLRVDAEDVVAALRQLKLTVMNDDYSRPQVEAPLGDFFAAAPGVNVFDSMAFSVEPDGTMTCRFPMPCKKVYRLFIRNMGTVPVRVVGDVLHRDYNWDEERSMYFHAKWRMDQDITGSDPVTDIPYIFVMGKGLFVGCSMHIMHPTRVPTLGGGWWGEGDEKIFIDGEDFPSIFGTGSEDYFNYAWSTNQIWTSPYAGQPRSDGPGSRGFIANYRFQIIDHLPFKEALAFFLELGAHSRTPGMDQGRIAYYYARPGTIDDHMVITGQDMRKPQMPEHWTPVATHGAKDFVFYEADAVVTEMDHTLLVEKDRIYSSGEMLVWKPTQSDSTVAFNLPAQKSGQHEIAITVKRHPGAGAFSAELNGKPVHFTGPVTDLHIPHGYRLRSFFARGVEMNEGDNTLTLINKTPADRENTQIGIDFLWVK